MTLNLDFQFSIFNFRLPSHELHSQTERRSSRSEATYRDQAEGRSLDFDTPSATQSALASEGEEPHTNLRGEPLDVPHAANIQHFVPLSRGFFRDNSHCELDRRLSPGYTLPEAHRSEGRQTKAQAVSHQPSAISHLLSAICHLPSAICSLILADR